MFASLPMYLRPETEAAHLAYWGNINDSFADHGLPSAKFVLAPNLPDHWQSDQLLFSQTCGRPYATVLRDHVTLVATPDYGLADCPAGHYRSAIVVRTDDPRDTIGAFDGATLAYNELGSQSGYAAAIELNLRFGGEKATGSHLGSCALIADGQADIATIDAVTWALAGRYDDTSRLRVLGWTRPNPGLPYITAQKIEAAKILVALRQALNATSKEIKDILMIRDLVHIPDAAYLSMVNEDEL